MADPGGVVIYWLDGILVATFGVHQVMAKEKLVASPSAKQELRTTMTYVITQPCISTKDASCVDVCPVDCIHPTQNEEAFETAEILYINPDECIDCGACEPSCPVTAIFEESAVPPEWQQYIKINADFFKNNG